MNQLGFRAKIMLTVLGSLLLIFGLMLSVLAWNTRKEMSAEAFSSAENMAQQYAQFVQRELDSSIGPLQTLTSSLTTMKQQGVPQRSLVNQMLLQMMQDNPALFDLWLIYEHNAFDGKDAEYTQDKTTYPSGAYAPWALRKDGKPELMQYVHDSKTMSADDIKKWEAPYYEGAYYLAPKNSNKPSLVEPYIDPDTKVLMISFSQPVQHQGQFVGVVGGDVPMLGLQKTLSQA
ncbi:MAG: cache domain-containing protein, partial [Iodobacter sp.]